jgi:hypothetical protein
MSLEEALQTRLKSLPNKRYKSNEMFNIISEFLLSPLLPDIIELNNILHWVVLNKDGNSSSIDIRYEKKKRSGLLSSLFWVFNRWGTGLRIKYEKDGQIFICSYYRHSFYSLAEQLKTAYYEKLHDAFHAGFVIVDKTR